MLESGIEPATSRFDVRSRPVSTCPALPPLNLTGKSVIIISVHSYKTHISKLAEQSMLELLHLLR